MNIPSGAMNTRFTKVETTSNVEPVKEEKKAKKTKKTKIKEETKKTKEIVLDDEYTILDWVRTLLILTLPIVNIFAIIVWIAKRPLNKTAGNYAIGVTIYFCIMACIGAIYYFFIM